MMGVKIPRCCFCPCLTNVPVLFALLAVRAYKKCTLLPVYVNDLDSRRLQIETDWCRPPCYGSTKKVTSYIRLSLLVFSLPHSCSVLLRHPRFVNIVPNASQWQTYFVTSPGCALPPDFGRTTGMCSLSSGKHQALTISVQGWIPPDNILVSNCIWTWSEFWQVPLTGLSANYWRLA
jgi:hypothetical protein